MTFIKKILSFPLLVIIYAYKYVISPLTPASCRHYPSCSEYGVQAIRAHGPLLGSWLAVSRIARCHPWGRGGIDPVPKIIVKKIHPRKRSKTEPI